MLEGIIVVIARSEDDDLIGLISMRNARNFPEEWNTSLIEFNRLSENNVLKLWFFRLLSTSGSFQLKIVIMQIKDFQFKEFKISEAIHLSFKNFDFIIRSF